MPKTYFACFFAAKSLMTASKLIVSVMCLCIDRIPRFVSLAWLMVDRKYVFITFSFVKLLYFAASHTDIVTNIRSAMVRFVFCIYEDFSISR